MNTPDIHDDIDAFYDNLTLEQRQDADILDRLEFAADLGITGDEEVLEDAMNEIYKLRNDRASLITKITILESIINNSGAKA